MPMRRIDRPAEVGPAPWRVLGSGFLITAAVLPIDDGKLAGMAPFR